jgi:tRNA modification GTPase
MAETIYALSSAAGKAGVAVIRISGAAAADVCRQLTGRELPAPRSAVRRQVRSPFSDDVLDEGLVLWFPGPSSFTGEDVVELHIHGGLATVTAVLEAVGEMPGTRVAEPGEFTRRAFLNEKLDLTAAEGLADLIDAETEAQRRQAILQSSGALGRLYESWRDRLMGALAHVEAAIDFPEEGLPESVLAGVQSQILGVLKSITQHVEDRSVGEQLRRGIRVAIVGPPNAGKSSLLNALAGRDAAIVSEMAGTTRDVVEVRMDLAGFPVILSDTAGLREAADQVEVEGVRRARATAGEADVVIAVVDGSQPLEEVEEIYRSAVTLTVVNKLDLGVVEGGVPVGGLGLAQVSVRTGKGVDGLLERLSEIVTERWAGDRGAVITRARHREAVQECQAALVRAQTAVLPELLAEDLRLAMQSLGRITGSYDVEDLLDIVFRDFCIGK